MKPENLYLIELSNDQERFYKIGTTVHRYCRFYQLMKHGYNATVIYMIMGIDPYIALEYERLLQSLFDRHYPLIKFGGHTECFKSVDLSKYKSVVSKLNPVEVVENLEISWR